MSGMLVANVGGLTKAVVATVSLDGNPLYLTQPTDGARPLFCKPSSGLSWLQGDGTDDYLTTTFGQVLPQPFTRVTAARFVAVGADKRLLSGGPGAPDDGQLYLSDGPDGLRMYAGNIFSVGFVPEAGVDYVFTEIYNGANSKFAVDDGEYSTGDAGTGPLTGMTLFALANGTQVGHARISECVLFSGVASDAVIAQARASAYIAQGRAP